MKRWAWLILLALSCVVGSVAAQETLKAEMVLLDAAATYTVGDPIPTTLIIIHSADFRPILPTWEKEWGDFEVSVASSPQTITNDDGTFATAQQLTLVAWQAGTLTTPQLVLQLNNIQGEYSALLVPSIPITITSVLEGEPLLKDIKPQAVLEPPFPWGAWLSGILLVGGVGVVLLRRRRAPLPQPALVVDTRRPRRRAVDQLTALAQEGYLARSEFDRHYTESADVLRHYLAQQFAIPAPDLTTRELQQTLQDNNAIPSAERESVLALLSEADVVKFARLTPDLVVAEQFIPQLIVVIGRLDPEPSQEITESPPEEEHLPQLPSVEDERATPPSPTSQTDAVEEQTT